MKPKHWLKAMALWLALSSLAFAENPPEFSEMPLEEEESFEGAVETPSEDVMTTASCRSLTCDIPLTDKIETSSDSDCFSFSVPEGTIVHLSVVRAPSSASNFFPVWRLLNGQGKPAPSCSLFRATDSDCGPLPASGNPYRIEVEDSGRDATGTYGARVCRP
jgi:hypothetical protein